MSKDNTNSSPSQNRMLALIAAGFAFLFQLQVAGAQSADHQADSTLHVDYTGLTAEMGIQPQNLNIDGAATYRFKALTDSVAGLLLKASDMEIISVSVDGQEADYKTEGDSLAVSLPEPVMKEEQHKVRIRYSSAPKFGLLKDSRGTVWTSLLPRSQRHWIPVVDNPQAAFKTSFTISVPAEYQVWATGAQTGREAVNEQIVQYRFTSDTNIPASGLSFAVGDFTSDSTNYNNKTVNLAVQQSLADSVDIGGLLQQAARWMDEVKEETGTEYPFSSLNIIVLPDHNWETKSWGASTIYLYQNRGSLQHQLLRGLTGQWAAARSRPAHWQQADAVTLYQTLIGQSVAGKQPDLPVTDQPTLSFTTVYEQFGTARWNAWQRQWQQRQDSTGGLFSNIPPGMLQQFLLMISGPDYRHYWDGQPVFKLPETGNSSDSTAAKSAPADSVAYSVDYLLDEAKGSLQLRFSAEQGRYDRPVTVRVHRVSGDGSAEVSDVTFSGQNDSVNLPVSGQLRSAWITVPKDLRLKLDENKPVSYLLYELRNGKTTKQKALAARNLGDHTQNPDIQLAVTDALSRDVEPAVEAGLLASLADITSGAAGTHQTFLEALDSSHEAVQKAGLYGLRNYPDNAGVRSRVQSFTINAQDKELFGAGLTAYADLAPDDEFKTLLSKIAEEDSTGHRSITALQYLAGEKASVELITESLARFLNADQPYETRQRVLNVLAEYDQSSESWLARGKKALTGSADPRIRYLVAQGMLKNSSPEIQSFLKDYLPTEGDARVHQLIETGISPNYSRK